MKYAQILNDKVHWIFDSEELIVDLQLRFSPELVFIDITNTVPQPSEGWLYSNGICTRPSSGYECTLDEFKQTRIEEINNECKTEIISGLISNALGEPHRYDTDLEDQLNFSQAMAVALINRETYQNEYKAWKDKITADPECTDPEPVESSIPYRIWDTNGIAKSWYPHYYKTFQDVLVDGSAYKGQLLYTCSILKARVAAATTHEEVDSIVWTPIGLQPIEPK